MLPHQQAHPMTTTTTDPITRRTFDVLPGATGCLAVLASGSALVGHLLGEEVTGGKIPLAPWWVVGSGAAAVAGWTVLPARLRTARPALVVGCAALVAMLSGTVSAIPHSALFAVIWLIQLVHPGTNVFPLVPTPGILISIGTHLITLVACAAIAVALSQAVRLHQGLCRRCGRREADPTNHPVGWLPIAAIVSIAACLPYAAIKVAWGLGWKGGITGHQFDQVTISSPGFGDTAALALVSVLISIAMVHRVRRHVIRMILILVGGLGSAMLLPIGVLGVVDLIANPNAPANPEMATWVFEVIYTGFLLWGIGLTALTVGYTLATRPRCRRHLARAGA